MNIYDSSAGDGVIFIGVALLIICGQFLGYVRRKIKFRLINKTNTSSTKKKPA